MDPLTLQVLRRYTHKQGGVFEAPPGLYEDIYEWALAVAAASGIEVAERSLAEIEKQQQEQQQKLDTLLKAVDTLVANPTNWKLYVAVYDQTWIFGNPGTRWKVTDFQKLTPEKKAALQERVNNYAESIRERASGDVFGYDRAANEVQKELTRLRSYSRPGVGPLVSGKVSKSFPVNLTGWRYGNEEIQRRIEERVKIQAQEMLDVLGQAPDSEMIAKMIQQYQERARSGKGDWDTIRVELNTTPTKTAQAYWQPYILRMVITLPVGVKPYDLDDLGSYLRHELRHFAQSLLAFMMAGDPLKMQHGLPSKRIRTPEFKQQQNPKHPGFKPDDPATKALHQRLRSQGIKVDEVNFHDLDDVEFYTELADAIDDFKRKQAAVADELTDDNAKRTVIKLFTGVIPHRDAYDTLGSHLAGWFRLNKFFAALKGQAPGKYRKALTEFVKAVL